MNFILRTKLNSFFRFTASEKKIFDKHLSLSKIIKENNFDINETFYIGDETRDVEAAKKVGLKTIAVTWGAESKMLIEKANPDCIIEHPEGLLTL